MKRIKRLEKAFSFLALLTFCLLLPGKSIAEVCSDGTGIPPFLTSGGKSNLLLVLDNSGSMLDLAYVDTIGECTDDSFATLIETEPNKIFAGLFDNTKWYEWKIAIGDVEGYFEEVDYTTSAAAANSNSFSGVEGTPYSYLDYLFVKFTEVTEAVDGEDDVTTQTGVSAFSASGKLLNWASASKFDIQKGILTGGKYDPVQQVLVSEGRGCSASPFVKEVPVKTGEGENIISKVITFSIRGFEANENEATGYKTDNITHIAIMGITDSGFINSTNNEYCQLVIDEYAKGADNFIDCEELIIDCEGLTVDECEDLAAAECKAEEVATGKTSLGRLQQYIEACLDYTEENNVLAESNAAYNHSIQKCWFSDKKGYDEYQDFIDHTDVSSVQNACQNIYWNGVYPEAISPFNSGYVCYGDSAPPLTGYLGRCWVPGTLPLGCTIETCDDDIDPGEGDGTGTNVRCFGNKRFQCLASYNRPQDICSSGTNKDAWTPVLENDVDPTTDPCPENAVGEDGHWTEDTDQCLKDALWDYCNYLKVGEVIDATDMLHNTGQTWGMVGALVDAGIVSMFGTEIPLIVMKGHIKETSPPKGVIHDVADNLRIGVMAFNANGADYECDQGNTTADTIVQHCPDENQDGARVIAQIKNGDAKTPTPENPDKIHVDDLTVAINSIEANAWTPLAEALYNALGYYGQNEGYRLYSSDFTTADDPNQPALPAPPWEDPVQSVCQQNNILVITEGASTTDINPAIVKAVTDLAGLNLDGYPAMEEGECKSLGLNNGESELYSSTYLDNLAFLGQNAVEAGVFTTPVLDGENKDNIKTYFVTTGLDRDNIIASDQCNPAVLMDNAAEEGGTNLLAGENPADLESKLRDALTSILNRSSAGSTASVIANSRSGEGGVYQAIFWPEIPRGIGKDPLTWVGDVHAFFIDKNGWFWDDYSSNGRFGELWSEDNNGLAIDGDGILNAELDENGSTIYPEDLNGNGSLDGDRRITTFYNSHEDVLKTQICFNSDRGEPVDSNGGCQLSDYTDTPRLVEIREFNHYLWSANKQLSDPNLDTTENRGIIDGKWDFSENHRYIFTWNDLDNDGIVDYEGADINGDGLTDGQSEILPFVSGMNTPLLATASNRGTLLNDFNVLTDDNLNHLIQWVRGDDTYYEEDDNGTPGFQSDEDINENGIQDYVFRCRKYPDCPPPDLDDGTTNPTWRLGDVINSAPTLVAKPAERYHFPYKDREYGEFYKQYLDRRHVVYFGANDGMLHALNGGFYQSGSDKFATCSNVQRKISGNENCTTGNYPELGEELWAYIPYNLQPHLSCLTDPLYAHKYFVDGPPRIFDVRIFPDDTVHPAGWGTILVGYMRFGGAPTLADDTTPFTDNREFISSYFILDITDPERPPTLIAEMTMTTEDTDSDPSTDNLKYTSLGYTTSMPTVVPMRNDAGNSEWFLVLGNGPSNMEGENDQKGKIAIVPLNSLTGVNWKANDNGNYDPNARQPFRIPNEEFTGLSGNADLGIKRIPVDSNGEENSFVGDMVSVDFDINAKSIPDIGIPYKTDVVYFGTVDGTEFDDTGQFWDGDGRLFRLVTNPLFQYTDGEQNYTYPKDWELKTLLDAQGPITAAPNIATDGSNFWVYFGTGRFYAQEDKPDVEMQYFFGVKEPRKYVDPSCEFSWNKINWWNTTDSKPETTLPGADPGVQGLLRTDPVRVLERETSVFETGDYIYCEDDDGNSCTLPLTLKDPGNNGGTYYLFDDLVEYIQGNDCSDSPDPTLGIDGWYRQFNGLGERSLGMPVLLGGLVTYTGYEPGDVCEAEGTSSLYGVYYLTGSAWYQSVFGTYQDGGGKNIVRDKYDLGKGLTMTPSLQAGGSPNGPDATAFVQTSTGEVVEIPQENLPIQNFKSGRTSWKSE